MREIMMVRQPWDLPSARITLILQVFLQSNGGIDDDAFDENDFDEDFFHADDDDVIDSDEQGED